MNGNIHTIKSSSGIKKASLNKINHGFKVDLDVFKVN